MDDAMKSEILSGIFENPGLESANEIGEYARTAVPVKAVPMIEAVLNIIIQTDKREAEYARSMCSTKNPARMLKNKPKPRVMRMKPW